jgi:diguanylate cyclase (GGDEF)-like protein
MRTGKFVPTQSLNEWVAMLHGLYGGTQNYSKTSYEIHTHLTEVCGAFGKFYFKKRDPQRAITFLPKMFAWAVALLKTIRPEETDLEGIILRKFPGVCPYCGVTPCICWKGEKPTLNSDRLREDFYRNSKGIRRSLNDFQLLFSGIYEDSWRRTSEPEEVIRLPFTRMIEELAEIAEAIRFYHIYRENFENELADFFAWWFALSCLIRGAADEPLLAEKILWKAYPGCCTYCDQYPCFCRPGPVRELMSKPPPGQDHKYDGLTALYNQGAYKVDVSEIVEGELPVALPVSCVRIDIDDFKAINDRYGHEAGDAALRHVASVLRAKARERDRIYRISGDEFGVILMDMTAEEAGGMMRRVLGSLLASPVRWIDNNGGIAEFNISASIGVAQCETKEEVKVGFERADQASYQSKEDGKAKVSIFPRPLNPIVSEASR